MFLSTASPTYTFVPMQDRKLEQQAWIKAVASELGMSISALAKLARLVPSTLNKFMNDPDHEGLLKDITLVKISEASNIPILKFPGRPTGFSENEAIPFVMKSGQWPDHIERAIGDLMQDKPGRDAWVVKSRSLDQEGVLPGDILIVDLNMEPTPGSTVCAQLYDLSADRAETAFRKFHPPYLLSNSSRGLNKPMLVDNDTVKIMGVVDGLIRP